MSLPPNAVLSPIPDEVAGPYDPVLIKDLKGLLSQIGSNDPEVCVERYDVVLALALLGVEFVKSRNNTIMSAQAINSMMERYSVAGPGAVDYVVYMADTTQEVVTGVGTDGKYLTKTEPVKKLMRVSFPKPDDNRINREEIEGEVGKEISFTEMTDEELVNELNEQALSQGPAEDGPAPDPASPPPEAEKTTEDLNRTQRKKR